VDGHALLAQPRAGPEDLVERADLEGEVVQAAALAPGGAPDEGDAVMVGVDPEEDHAAGHHGVRIAIAHAEPEHAGVEGHRAVQIGDVEHDVADLPELELHRREYTAKRGSTAAAITGSPSSPTNGSPSSPSSTTPPSACSMPSSGTAGKASWPS
jgi:hypothetical protein